MRGGRGYAQCCSVSAGRWKQIDVDVVVSVDGDGDGDVAVGAIIDTVS
jgi:hypothetical protein